MKKTQSRPDLYALEAYLQEFQQSQESIPSHEAETLARIRDQIDQILAPTQTHTPSAPTADPHLFEEIVRSISDGVMAIDHNWTITYVNTRAAQSGLSTPQELIGKNLWERYPNLLGTTADSHYRAVMEDRIPLQFEMEGIMNEAWYLISVYPSDDGIIIYWLDFTTRKRTELEIQQLLKTNRRQNALLEGVFETDPNGVAVVAGADLHFTYVNPVYRYITPDPRLDPVGRAYTEVWPTTSRYANRDRYRQVIDTGQPFQISGIEYEFSDGSKRYFSVQARRMDWDGQPACLIILWDVSDQVRFERALEEANIEIVNQKNRLEAVLESLPIGLAILDQQGGIARANPAFHRIWGNPIPETKTTEDYFQFKAWWADSGEPLDQDEWAAARSIRNMETVVGQYLRIQRFDGSHTYVLNSAAPIFDAYGRISGSSVTVIDVSERRKMEKALQSSESRLKLFVEFAPAAIAMLDRDMRYITTSRRYVVDYHLGDQNLIGRSHYEVFPDIPENWKEIHRRCLAGAVEKCSEDPFVHANGDVDWIRWEIHPWFEESGEIGGLILFSEVITEYKLAEEAIKKSRQKFEQILESIQDGFFELDRNWRFTYMNHRAGLNLRRQPQDLIGKNLWECFPIILGTEHETFYRQVMEQQVPAQLEFKMPVGDNWYEMHAYPSSEGITVFWADITERKKATEALHESEARAQAQLEEIDTVIQSMSDALIVYDADGNIIRTNWAAAAFFRIDPMKEGEQMTGILRSLRRLDGSVLPEASWPGTRALNGEKISGEIFRIKNASGHERIILVSANPIYDADEKIRGAVVVWHYITNRMEVENQARKASTELEVQHRLIDQREQERTQIARDLHDGPVQDLAVALQMLNLLLMNSDNPEIGGQIKSVRDIIQQQIEELRAFAGELRPPSLSNFGLGSAIRNHIGMFQAKYPDLKVDYDEHQEGALLPLDIRLALYRIYQESLINITKHSQAHSVKVRFVKKPDQVVLEIDDDGVGFNVPGDWLELARSGHLGLLGMKERAEAVGGGLAVRSSPNNGTKIRVVVPLHE